MSLLPWRDGIAPLMLAPMQGLTNGALRACYIERYRPDVVFTEFVRVQAQSRQRISRIERNEIIAHDAEVPLVAQLVGNCARALSDAARQLEDGGCRHLNFNLGCPYGRMTSGATGGELLNDPDGLVQLLTALRKAIKGSFSIKCRAGYSEPRQLFELLPLYRDIGIDYLILHPRTVLQKYTGIADHTLTAEAIASTDLPVIANGDINNAAVGQQLLKEGVAGLMLGRGALADPWLFERIRGRLPERVDEKQRRRDVFELLTNLMPRYLSRFCGERQALMKLKDLLNFIPDECLQRDIGKLKRTTTIDRFVSLLESRFSGE